MYIYIPVENTVLLEYTRRPYCERNIAAIIKLEYNRIRE